MAAPSRRGRFIKDTTHSFIALATWIPALICFNDTVAELTWVNGPSMRPTLNPDFHSTLRRDVVLAYKWIADTRRDPKKGAIVLLR